MNPTSVLTCAGCGKETLGRDVIFERVEDMAALLAQIGAAALPTTSGNSAATENFLVRLSCGHWSLMKVHDGSWTRPCQIRIERRKQAVTVECLTHGSGPSGPEAQCRAAIQRAMLEQATEGVT